VADRGPKLAVLGLGTMGRAMAGSALRNGLPTVVWDRDAGVASRMADQGAEVAGSVADVVTGVDMVITMVTDARAVMAIAVDLGMLAALPAGVVWAQMSTIGVEGPRPSARSSRSSAPMSCSSTRPCREARSPPSREADHLCLWDRRGAAYCRACLRGNRATYGLAGRCRARLAHEARQQHPACVRG